MIKSKHPQNEYLVYYEDYKGEPHTRKKKAMTTHEAIIFVRKEDISYKNVKAELIMKPTPSIKDMFP